MAVAAIIMSIIIIIIIIIIPYSAKFSRRTIFADWRFKKSGTNFRGPRDASTVYDVMLCNIA